MDLIEPRAGLIAVLLRKRLQSFFESEAQRDDSEAECGRIGAGRLHGRLREPWTDATRLLDAN